jgi:hypothetical protein
VNPRAETYQSRAQRFEAELGRLERRSRLVANLRGASFGLFVVGGLVGAFGSGSTAAYAASALGLLLFVALVVVHDRVFESERVARGWARVNRDALSRVGGHLQELDDGADLAPQAHPYASDLDLFGRGSLYQRVSVAHTPYGRRTLASWLLGPASVEDIRRRQGAVRALGPELELRQRIEVGALGVAEPVGSGRGIDPEPFVAWAEGTPALRGRWPLLWASRLLPLGTALLALAATLGLLGLWAVAIPVVLQGILLARVSESTARTFGAVSATEGALASYAPLFQTLEEMDVDAEWISSVKERLASPGRRPSTAMRRFRRIVSWFELRHNSLVHPFINLLTLWDVHCVLALEDWQMESGREVRRWLGAVGELEAMCCLSTLAYDEPDWCFGEVTDGAATYAARGLGHPLIDGDVRVSNDVTIDVPGSGLLITGSNMSGKSTLLRAMGLAAVMTLAGGPACAKSLRIARTDIRTSLRIGDSLERGVSHFYAEVSRLKEALDATEGPLPVLFLLDEILHGTNSEERQIGARWVLGRLLDAGAIGAVTTHDEKLCRLEGPLAERLLQFHFQEDVKGGKMTFDFRLRTGPVRGGNALRVMRLLGMDVPIPDDSSHESLPEPT